ncbi:MAG TPA: hypothetical protein VFA22_06630 [Stellaceae bacterium]|nr:hypothetical protein [Stellaceae bacterium]
MGGLLGARAVFVGCAQNCAVTLPRVLGTMERLSALFAERAFVLLENDSRDATKQVLRAWCATRPAARLVERDGLAAACPIRTIRLAQLRNSYLATVRAEFADWDYLVVFDCDEVNDAEIDSEAMRRAIDFLARGPSRAGVFANPDGIYRDIWALRHPKLCPGDAWEEVLDYGLRHKVADDEAFTRTFRKRIVTIARSDPPLEVASAFGGLAIYKIASVLGNARPYVGYKKKLVATPQGSREVGWQVCEHVSFNAGFGERGEKLYILPYLVNGRIAQQWFPPDAYRLLIFDLKAAGLGD